MSVFTLNNIKVSDEADFEIFCHNIVYTKEEFELIKKGYAFRKTMDERWWIEYHNGWVYIIRSWVKWVAYKVQFERRGDKYYSARAFTGLKPESQEKYQQYDKLSYQNYHLFNIYSLLESYIFKRNIFTLSSFVFLTKIDFNSIHGISHWQNVYRLGKKLAAINGADEKIIYYFAHWHDFFRQRDYEDAKHGHRAAAYLDDYRCDLSYDLNKKQVEKLKFAIIHHADKKEKIIKLDNELKNDITVQTCWDADRLDLGRLSIIPESSQLFTETAKGYFVPKTI